MKTKSKPECTEGAESAEEDRLLTLGFRAAC
jgi:hypothetical protein